MRRKTDFQGDLELKLGFDSGLKSLTLLCAIFMAFLLLAFASMANRGLIGEFVKPKKLDSELLEFKSLERKQESLDKSFPALRPQVKAAKKSGKYLDLQSQLESSNLLDQAESFETILGDDFISSGKLSVFDSLVDRAPKLKVSPPIRYPKLARKAKIEGAVSFRLWINAKGVVERVKIEKSEPAGVFDEAVKKAALKYKFEPAVLDAKAVAVTARQKVEFKLK